MTVLEIIIGVGVPLCVGISGWIYKRYKCGFNCDCCYCNHTGYDSDSYQIPNPLTPQNSPNINIQSVNAIVSDDPREILNLERINEEIKNLS